MPDEAKLARTTATAILGIDTLWGGDVIDPSGAGRFIADSWFSEQPLPQGVHQTRRPLRLAENGAGVRAGDPGTRPAI